MTSAAKKTPQPKQKSVQPLMSKVVRVRSEDLEPVLAQLDMTEDNKRRTRDVLVHGRVMREIAREDKVSPELISSAVRRVRAKLNNRLSAWTFVTLPLTLPLTLAEELRSLSDGLDKMQDKEKAEAILKEVVKSVALAKVKVLYD